MQTGAFNQLSHSARCLISSRWGKAWTGIVDVTVGMIGRSCILASIAVFLILTVWGVLIFFTPVPWMDMWNGYLGFYVRAVEGDGSVWLAQHNEHRIFLSRILFFIDQSVFGGRAPFLVLCNVALAVAAAFMFRELIKDLFPDHRRIAVDALFAIVAILCLSWVQHENFRWEFQSQFFLAQSLPLLALLLAARAKARLQVGEPGASACFLGSLATGVASALAMANGVFALAIVAALCFLAKAPRSWTMAALGTFVLTIILYLRDYQSPPGHSSPIASIIEHPMGVAAYVLTYLGSPLVHLADATPVAVAMFGGAAVVAGALYFFWGEVRLAERSPTRLALLGFLAYIGLTASITALGRVDFGLQQATASRYATPALMAWAALVLLCAERWRLDVKPVTTSLALGGIAAFFLPAQLLALNGQTAIKFQRNVAALAVELGVRDPAAYAPVLPFYLPAVDLAPVHDLSVFGTPQLMDAGLELGDPARMRGTGECTAHLDQIERRFQDSAVYFVRGWYVGPGRDRGFSAMRFIDQDGVITGFAIIGGQRPDVAAAYGKHAARSGFEGFIFAGPNSGPVTISPRSGGCETPVSFLRTAYRIGSADDDSLLGGAVISNEGFVAPISGPPGVEEVRAYASDPAGDASLGRISITLNRGDAILYQSGPESSRQYLSVANHSEFATGLPAPVDWTRPRAEGWVKLLFDEPTLPDSFDVTIADEGDAWGEWSAIGLRHQSMPQMDD